jgi:hypothetical protein
MAAIKGFTSAANITGWKRSRRKNKNVQNRIGKVAPIAQIKRGSCKKIWDYLIEVKAQSEFQVTFL